MIEQVPTADNDGAWSETGLSLAVEQMSGLAPVAHVLVRLAYTSYVQTAWRFNNVHVVCNDI